MGAGARVVKAFNTVGSSIMANSVVGGEKALLFYCGDDHDAKNVVHGLAWNSASTRQMLVR
jgi:predicted dinucleotide-binding enzyme